MKNINKKDELILAVKYLFCTIGAGLIQVISFAILNSLIHFDSLFHFVNIGQLKYGPSYFIALILSVIFNFTVNRKVTFKSANNIPIAMMKIFGYYLIFTPASIWWGEALAQIGWNEYAILIPTMIINYLTEFTFCRFIVFGDSINTAIKTNKK